MRNFDLHDIEYIASNFSPDPTGDDFLDSRYMWQAIKNGSEWPYYRFFYRLSGILQPELIVELGGYQGTAAAHFAVGRREAKVISIDHHTDPGDEENQAKMMQACYYYSNITYIQGWTNPELAASQFGKHALGNAPNALSKVKALNKKIDILFIDSWHTYQNAKMDFDTYRELLNSPALVICDDIQDGEVDGNPISGMMRFWKELPEPKYLNSNLHPGTNMGFFEIMHRIKTNELENVFVTADHHFGHENIIKFCNRPFENIDEMDETLIDNWNKVVSQDDIVYHLGDFTLGNFETARKYFKRLNGKIQVLANHWHHDRRWLPKDYFGSLTLEYPSAIEDIEHVNIIPPMTVLELEGMGGEGRSLGVTLCHYPLEVWDRKHYGAWHLYGHTHKHDNSGEFAKNIGVDCTNFTPISLGSVLQYMYEMGW